MAGNSKGAKKGAKVKRERGFDFAAAGALGGKAKVEKGQAKMSKKKRKEISRKGVAARRSKD